MTVSGLLLMLQQTSSLEHVVKNTINMLGESLASSGKSSDVRRCYVYVIRHTVAMMSNEFKFSSKGLKKRVLDQSGD